MLTVNIRGGRVVTLEIMRQNPSVHESILRGESDGKTFYEIIDAGVSLDM